VNLTREELDNEEGIRNYTHLAAMVVTRQEMAMPIVRTIRQDVVQASLTEEEKIIMTEKESLTVIQIGNIHPTHDRDMVIQIELLVLHIETETINNRMKGDYYELGCTYKRRGNTYSI